MFVTAALGNLSLVCAKSLIDNLKFSRAAAPSLTSQHQSRQSVTYAYKGPIVCMCIAASLSQRPLPTCNDGL